CKMNVGPESSRLVCPKCKMSILTTTTPRSSSTTHLIALLMCCCSCCICAPFLYCTECARNIEHTCPSCNNYIGTYKR
ncbi:hypothetical protein KR215_010024, partial [Drosophila sulfurigaster]